MSDGVIDEKDIGIIDEADADDNIYDESNDDKTDGDEQHESRKVGVMDTLKFAGVRIIEEDEEGD